MENFKELSFEEMQDVNGGGWGLLIGGFALYVLYDIAGNPGETIETFKSGFSNGYNSY